MATEFKISVGPLTASKTFANDTKARDTLLSFYTAYNLGPTDATNQQKLQAILDWFVVYLRNQAVTKYETDKVQTARTEGEALYGFE